MAPDETASQARPPLREYGLLLVLATCWGATYPLTKIAIETIPPVTFICWRSFIAAAVLLPILWWRGLRLPRDWPAWRILMVQQMINGVLPFLAITWAQQYVPASLTVVLASTTPIWAFLITWGITRHEPATGRKLLGVALGLAGAVTIVGIEALGGLGQSVIAQVVIVLATLSFAVATINGRNLRHTHPLVVTAGSVLFGAVLLLPFSLVIDAPWRLAPSTASLQALVVLALTGTALGLMIFYRLVATIGPIATNSSSYLRIPIGVGLSILVVGESVPASLWAGLALVVAGVAAMSLPQRRTR